MYACANAAEHWQSTEAVGTAAAFEDHLVRFPGCAYAGLARARIDDLKSKGMNVQVIDQQPFREQLKKAGFYAEWQKKFGDKGWGALESVAGSLV